MVDGLRMRRKVARRLYGSAVDAAGQGAEGGVI